MTCYDSSVLIDYLAGEDRAVDFVTAQTDQRSVAPPLVLYEVYQGEVHRSERADFDAVESALEWLTVPETGRSVARMAAELQASLAREGTPLAARDAFVAGAAAVWDEPFVVSDADFDVPALYERLDLTVL
ncbi:MAG: PIN domain-containing protein [Halococcoides sp.]